MSETIIVLDFGSQYSQLIARRIRECRVYSKIMPYNTPAETLRAENPKGIILSGGPSSVYAKNAPKCDPAVFDLGIPILGICYGLQLMIQTLGGEIARGKAREYGKAILEIREPGELFAGISPKTQVWMSHGDKVARMPEGGFEVLGSSGNTEFCAVHMRERNFYGIQFHPEVVHTPEGKSIIANFCRRVCECSGDWTMESFIEQQVREIRKKVGSANVILGLSGGVDSSVAAALINKAIGTQLNCIFVNNGVLRKNEAERVQELFGRNFAMLAKTFSAAVIGIDAYAVEIEVNASAAGKESAGNETQISIVGLPDMAVKESRDRVRSAIQSTGYLPPKGFTVVNLAPADIRKEGGAFDLGIALGMISPRSSRGRSTTRTPSTPAALRSAPSLSSPWLKRTLK